MASIWTRLDYRNWFVPGAINNPCFPAMDNNLHCQVCLESCPTQAITKQWGTITIDPERCNYCGNCYIACPGDLIGIQGLDKLLVRIKRDREKGASILHLYCDHSRHGDVMGAIKVPNYRYLPAEVLLWAAALGYSQVALPGKQICRGCRENCYEALLSSLDLVNYWLQYWQKSLELIVYTKPASQPDRQLTRRELFAGLGWNVKNEVTGLVAEELENHLIMVLPRAEQGYMRRQTLKAMAIKLLTEPAGWPDLAVYPEIEEACSGCRICSKQCPNRALIYEAEGLLIKPWLCSGCNFCAVSCPGKHITLHPVTEWNEFFSSRRHRFNKVVED